MPAGVGRVGHEGELPFGDARPGRKALHDGSAGRDALQDFPECGAGLGRRADARETGALRLRPQGGGLERGLDQRGLKVRQVAARSTGVGEDRRQVGSRHRATVLDHQRVVVDVRRHRPVQLDLELVRPGPAGEVGDRQGVDGVDRCVHDAAEVLGQRACGHGVGREDVLTVGSLEEHVRRHEVHAGVAAGRVLDHEQRRHRRLLAGRRELDGREVAALLRLRLVLRETAGDVPGAEHGGEGHDRGEHVQHPRLRALDLGPAPAAQTVAAVSLTRRHVSRCTTRVPPGPPRGCGR